MNVCVPVLEDRGLESGLSPHFGSAPAFVIVDTETGRHHSIVNRDLHHAHGVCQPLASLRGEKIDAVVVSGIGRGALGHLRAAGFAVYCSTHPTVGATLEALRNGKLSPVDPEAACGHHGHEHASSCCHGEPT